MPSGSKPGEHRGGRKAGQPNKPTRDLIERWDELGFDPIDKAIEIIEQQKIKNKDKMRDADIVQACIKLAEFKYPKRKPNDAPKDVEDLYVDKVYTTEWGNRRETSDAKDD
jgi:hypothetical protein